MKNCTQFLLTGCSALALLACGDDVTKMTNVTNETTGLEVAASADSLGTCDSSVIGKMMFASSENAVYVCADSGWTSLSKSAADGKNGADGSDGKDGENGLDGASCTVKALASGAGYKIICGGDSVGVILNGKNGSDGIDGKDGAAGNSCSAKALTSGAGYKIVCGGDSVGVILNGTNGKDGADGKDGTTNCSLTKNETDGTATLVCGETSVTYKAVTYDSLVDSRDGQVYKTVVIGTQTWMAENLNYEYNHETATSYCYNDFPEYCKTYGRLYTRAAAMDSAAVFSDSGKKVRGVCPEGWHLPDTTEWDTLLLTVQAQPNIIGKSPFRNDEIAFTLKSTEGWRECGRTADHGGGSEDYFTGVSANGSDALGFRILPAGTGFHTKEKDPFSYGYLGYSTGYWISNKKATILSISNKDCNSYKYYSNGYDIEEADTKHLYSVRCIKD